MHQPMPIIAGAPRSGTTHFIHIIRDGRDVALSLRRMWFSPGPEIDVQANHWSDFVTSARGQGARCRHYTYEDLILNSRETLMRLCEFLDLSYDDAMLSYWVRAPERIKEHEPRYRADGSNEFFNS